MSRGLPPDIDEVQAAELCRECAAQFPDGVRTLLSHNPGVATAAMELLSSHGEAAAAEAMASILEQLRHPVPLPDNTSLRQRLPLPFAVGLRDGMATFIASMAVLAATFFWRTPSPVWQHILAVTLASAHLGTGAYFGAHLGNAIRGRTAGWIGGALLGLGGAALTLTNIYRAHANSTLEPHERLDDARPIGEDDIVLEVPEEHDHNNEADEQSFSAREMLTEQPVVGSAGNVGVEDGAGGDDLRGFDAKNLENDRDRTDAHGAHLMGVSNGAIGGGIREAIDQYRADLKRAFVACWATGLVKVPLRDGVATFLASLLPIAIKMAYPQLGVGALLTSAAAQGVGGYFVGSKVGGAMAENRSWGLHPAGSHVPTALGAGLSALSVLNILQFVQMGGGKNGAQEQARMGNSVVGTTLYSGVRDVFQSLIGKRIFSQLILPEDKKLRLECSKNTARHALRLALGLAAYTMSSMTAGSLLGRFVNESIPDSGEAIAFSEEMVVAAGRALNEALDAFFGSVAMLLVFSDNVEVKAPIKNRPNLDDAKSVAYDIASRLFQNHTIGFASREFDKLNKVTASELDPRKAFAVGLTHMRGSVLNISPCRPPALLLAGGKGTRGDGDCLLHAVAGLQSWTEWRMHDPNSLRQQLANRIRDGARDQYVREIARNYLLDVAIHINNVVPVSNFHEEDAHEGNEQQRLLSVVSHKRLGEMGGHVRADKHNVHDGNAMLGALSPALQARLMHIAADMINPIAGFDNAVLKIEELIDEVIKQIAAYYRVSARDLPVHAVPLLADLLETPIVLHQPGGGVESYNGAGEEAAEHELPNAVHIRFLVLPSGRGHFERVVRNPSLQHQNPASRSPVVVPEGNQNNLSTSAAHVEDDDLERGERVVQSLAVKNARQAIRSNFSTDHQLKEERLGSDSSDP